ncbi:MAG: T9SS type A sorting domain-containing protein [Flavobacteriales bacterium]|nr:T9SS type A sorting domain-containing protein [Flavobacteriales bacterium]
MKRFHTLLIVASSLTATAQYQPPDPAGFEGIIVERYYVSDANDAADTDGGVGLTPGAVTYRIFVDLKPGYKFITLGGFVDHPLEIATTTSFFNNDDRGEAWGRSIPAQHLNKNTVAIDTWLTVGGASTLHWGILKDEDPDGSVVGGSNNNGGSVGVPLLSNTDPSMGLPLTTSDGLLNLGTPPPDVVSVGTAPDFLESGGGNSYSNDNFAFAVLGSVLGPTTSNRVLVGQFTTDGVFTFCLNVWVQIPDSLVCNDPNCHTFMEFYGELLPSDTSASTGYAGDRRFTHPTLCFDSSLLDCMGVYNGPAQPGTPCDDGDPDTSDDVYDANCNCVGEDCEGVLGGTALPGTPCDDGNAATINDTWQTTCLCEGVVGLNEQGASASMHVRPNPTRDLLWLEFSADNATTVRYELRDAVGRVLISQDLGVIASEWRGTIDMAGMSHGTYFLAVTTDRGTVMKRIVRN